MRTLVPALFLAALPAQSVNYYGPGAGILVTGQPRLGQTITIDTTQPLMGTSALGYFDTSGWLALGFVRTNVVIPIATSRVMVLTVPLVTLPMPRTTWTPISWTYATSYPAAIPNVPGLVGAKVMAQWLYRNQGTVYNLPPPQNSWLRYSTSNAVEITIGR